MLFNFLTFRVLISKALALALGVGAGLPLGKEGPNVHLAACIARVARTNMCYTYYSYDILLSYTLHCLIIVLFIVVITIIVYYTIVYYVITTIYYFYD